MHFLETCNHDTLHSNITKVEAVKKITFFVLSKCVFLSCIIERYTHTCTSILKSKVYYNSTLM